MSKERERVHTCVRVRKEIEMSPMSMRLCLSQCVAVYLEGICKVFTVHCSRLQCVAVRCETKLN